MFGDLNGFFQQMLIVFCGAECMFLRPCKNIKVMDVFEYFSYAAKKQLGYDLIILDPPSFARTKKVLPH